MTKSRWALAWIACTLVSLGLFARPKTTPIHPDEVYWIGSAYYHHLAFERFEWTHPDWKLQAARENPQVAKYVIGLGLALTGQHIVVRDMLGCFHIMFQNTPGAWGEGEEYAKRVAVVGPMNATTCSRPQGGPGVSRPRALPYLARYVMIACAALTSLLLFFFGASVANNATGLLASQLLLLHPHMVYAYNRTMSDPVALMFSAAAAFSTWKLLSALGSRHSAESRGPRAGSVIRLTLLTGVLLALACGAKMNALIVVSVFGGALGVAAIQAWRAGDRLRARRALMCGGLGLALALALFIVINPAILFDPIGGLIAVVREAQLNTAVQGRVMFQLHLTGWGEKFTAMSQVAGGPLPFLLAAAVVVAACVRSRNPGMWFVASWWAIAVVCVTAWIPFDWSRYMLPILVPFTLLAANVLVEGWRLTRSRSTLVGHTPTEAGRHEVQA